MTRDTILCALAEHRLWRYLCYALVAVVIVGEVTCRAVRNCVRDFRVQWFQFRARVAEAEKFRRGEA